MKAAGILLAGIDFAVYCRGPGFWLSVRFPRGLEL